MMRRRRSRGVAMRPSTHFPLFCWSGVATKPRATIGITIFCHWQKCVPLGIRGTPRENGRSEVIGANRRLNRRFAICWISGSIRLNRRGDMPPDDPDSLTPFKNRLGIDNPITQLPIVMSSGMSGGVRNAHLARVFLPYTRVSLGVRGCQKLGASFDKFHHANKQTG
jgi:hypothetical protein